MDATEAITRDGVKRVSRSVRSEDLLGMVNGSIDGTRVKDSARVSTQHLIPCGLERWNSIADSCVRFSLLFVTG
jgi:hypothetical protein